MDEPKEWWIKNGMVYVYEPEAGSWSYHVIEYSAYEAMKEQRDEARAKVKQLKENEK